MVLVVSRASARGSAISTQPLASFVGYATARQCDPATEDSTLNGRPPSAAACAADRAGTCGSP